jgi:hypothetical protein
VGRIVRASAGAATTAARIKTRTCRMQRPIIPPARAQVWSAGFRRASLLVVLERCDSTIHESRE